ncbi:MAG: type II secretion system F family protein [Planctomycetota bacterium]|jgi:general secretion pathway protein F|nr:type II secretion system F family protein [Planctomycetota bacterium]MDP6987864.1 type II secretion system F family protein [Planctomycetota bacterium]
MPIFRYKAIAPGGETKTGVIDADTARDARQRLRRDELLVSDIHEARGGRRSTPGEKVGVLARLREARRSRRTSLSSKDLDTVSGVTRQLGTMLASGIPLTETLRAMIEQAEDRRIETIFREIRESVNQGSGLGDALELHPALFTDLYVNMVRAGEATGNVDVVLSRLADYLQYQRTLRRKVVGALTYPAMMIALGMLVVTALMAFVVPKITAMLEDTGQTLPVPTQLLIAISDAFKDYWWVGALAIGAVSFVIERVYHNSDSGRLFLDRTMLRVPVVGDVLRKQAVSRFSKTLATLLQSGVNAVQSLEITSNVVQNRVIADATDHIRERILEGADIATPLKATGVFPALVGYMVAVGEQSGELEQMLDRIATAYDEEIEIATDKMTAVLEPLMIIGLAVVVGYIVVSIILPILQVGQIQ